jgi:glyoxylase-like metal-dependent hydrolase (beta-lactamase superfamily II)
MQIHVLDLHFLQLEHAVAAFLLEGPEGWVLVESGPHSTYAALQGQLSALGLRPGDIRAVLLSHIHFDHAGAAWALAEAGADIYVHPKGAPHLAAPEKLYQSARMIYDQMDILWGAMHPIAPERLHTPDDNAIVRVCGLECRALHTPGHAVHHIAWQVGDAVFTGDVAGVRIQDCDLVVPPCPPPDINVEDWQQSIERLRHCEAQTLYLTHYGQVTQKLPHLDQLAQRLSDWAIWMQPHAASGATPESVVPLFQAYVKQQLIAAGIDEAGQQQYEAANPAFMSVAGLMRYWKKKAV